MQPTSGFVQTGAEAGAEGRRLLVCRRAADVLVEPARRSTDALCAQAVQVREGNQAAGCAANGTSAATAAAAAGSGSLGGGGALLAEEGASRGGGVDDKLAAEQLEAAGELRGLQHV